MKERNILIAFLLNMFFAMFEFIGSIFTSSTAIMSDAIHDIGDALSIGVSYLLERKSNGKPDANYTYGYARYSVIGGAFTTLVLVVGSCIAICNAIWHIVHPIDIDYNGMIVFAVVGVVVNLVAALVTRKGDSINQKAVNLHMLEDVAGWVAVLVGAVVMRLTNLSIIDPILSLSIAIWIFIHASKAFFDAMSLLAEKSHIPTEAVLNAAQSVDGVINIHHLHVWSLNDKNSCATMHVITNSNHAEIKKRIREKLQEIGIIHSTLELESKWECCDNKKCQLDLDAHIGCACHKKRQ